MVPITVALGIASPRVRGELAHEMAGLVTCIYNSSGVLGEAPADWRRANAMPIFKSGGRKEKVRQAGIRLRA